MGQSSTKKSTKSGCSNSTTAALMSANILFDQFQAERDEKKVSSFLTSSEIEIDMRAAKTADTTKFFSFPSTPSHSQHKKQESVLEKASIAQHYKTVKTNINKKFWNPIPANES